MAPVRRVLIVEDYAPHRRSLQRVLTRAFLFETTAVGSGEEAIAQFPDIKPDLVLLDMHLPGVSGYDTLRSIRMLAGGNRVPAVVISGFDELGYITAMAPLGIRAYVTKPWWLNQLHEVLLAIFPDLDAPTISAQSV